MHRQFVKREQHVEMLMLALENLKRCQNVKVSLGIYDDWHDGEFRRRGYSFKASYQDCDILEPDPSTALDAVLTAWRRSKYPIQALKLFLSTQSDSLETLALGPASVLDSVLPYRSSEHATAFDLYVNVWQEQGSYARLKILSKFTCLELSRLDLGDPELTVSPLIAFTKGYYGRIWETIMSSPLRSVTLERSDVDYPRIIQLLQAQEDQLRTLKLRQVRMIVFEPPKNVILEFLRFLRDSLRLFHLSIKDFSVEEDGTYGPFMTLPASGEGFMCEGQEDINAALEILIEEVNQEYQYEGSDGFSELSETEYADY